MQESTTPHFTFGLMCIFVNFNSLEGATRVLFSKSFNLHDIQYSSKISSPNHIIFYQFKMITSENKHRIHENICADEWPYKCQVECQKLNVSLFLSRGVYLFPGSGKIRLGWWPFEYLVNLIFPPPEVKGSPKADMSPHIPTPQTFWTFQFHFWKSKITWAVQGPEKVEKLM